MGKRTYIKMVKLFMLLGAVMMLMASAGFSASQRFLPIINKHQAEYATKHVLVKLKPGKSINSLKPFLKKYNAKWNNRKVGESTYIINLPSNINAKQIINNKKHLMSAYRNIDNIELDGIAHLTAVKPNDPDYPDQWPLQQDDQIYAPEAWEYFKNASKKEAVVAVIDTGIRDRNDTNPSDPNEIWRVPHPDLVDNLLIGQGYDFGDYDDDPSPVEYSGFSYTSHGTHVAGTIAAAFNNNKGVAGLAPNGIANKKIWILPIKVADKYGDAYLSSIINAINFCAEAKLKSPITNEELKVDVINFSMGYYSYNSDMHEAIKEFTGNGGVFVSSSGNDGSNVVFPAVHEECIAVGATDSSKSVPWWSNTGPELDIVAPGVDIASTYWSFDLTEYKYPDPDDPPTPPTIKVSVFKDYLEDQYGNAYAALSGTSMATPHVSAAAAMLISIGAQHNEVADILKKSATPLDIDIPNEVSGYGLLNLYKAMTTAAVGVKIISPTNGQTVITSNHEFVVQFQDADVDSIRIWLDNILIIGPASEKPKIADWKTNNYSEQDGIATVAFVTGINVDYYTHKLKAQAASKTDSSAIGTDEVVFNCKPQWLTKGWNLFSIPAMYSSVYNPEDVLNLKSGALYRWIYANSYVGEYAVYGLGANTAKRNPEASFNPPSIYANDEVLGPLGSSSITAPAGLGYWLKVNDEYGIEVPAAYGTVVANTPYSISLHKGWNLIGNPFPYAVSWNIMLIEMNGSRLSLTDAVQKGWISASIYRWDKTLNNDMGEYVKSIPKEAVISPWEAQWIKVRLEGSGGWPRPDAKLIIPPNPYTGVIP